jgi:hypothetical protein
MRALQNAEIESKPALAKQGTHLILFKIMYGFLMIVGTGHTCTARYDGHVATHTLMGLSHCVHPSASESGVRADAHSHALYLS